MEEEDEGEDDDEQCRMTVKGREVRGGKWRRKC